MEPGNIVEYIDNQKLICAVVLDVKDKRLRLLTENNREVNLSATRLSHKSKTSVNLTMGRDKLVVFLKETAVQRNSLMKEIDVKELWEVLHSEEEPVDLSTMTELCFSSSLTANHESAVVRAFFQNRIYFKFNHDNFIPNTENQVKKILHQKNEEVRKNHLIETGSSWLKSATKNSTPLPPAEMLEVIEILKSYYLFGKESEHSAIGKAILSRAGVDSESKLFKLLVKLGVWGKDENLDLYRFAIPISFSKTVTKHANNLTNTSELLLKDTKRRDLTELSILTIDGRATLDFDDALSIEKVGINYRLGIHIIDVGHFIKKADTIDQDAFSRGSSIYMPDQKISMLPASLSEDFCSLRAGNLRPAMSLFATLSPLAQIIEYEIIPSVIKVDRQLTYFEVADIAKEDESLKILYELAKHFRQTRLNSGAVHLSLPEISIWFSEAGEIILNRVDRESPGRMLVAEMMILANWLMAKFLADNKTPAIFRSQPDPKERLIKNDQGTLFENWMQRKKLSRGLLGPQPEYHSGLGLDAYVTATSPIRRYFDLVTQRQLRAILGFERPYTLEEIKSIISIIEESVRQIGRLQYLRNRYWILKFLESKTGTKHDAIIIDKRRSNYTAMIPDYMIECKLPMPGGVMLKPGDLIQITIQHVNARNDALSVFMG